MDNTQSMHTGFLRLPDVLKLIPISKSTWWQGVKEGRFPSGVKIGAKITAWRVEDIQRLAASIGSTQATQSPESTPKGNKVTYSARAHAPEVSHD